VTALAVGEVRAMAGNWCGQMGIGGWLVMILFWTAFLGLAVWALTQLFGPRNVRVSENARDVLDRRLAAGELDPETYRRLRDELARLELGTR
jgi:uncharacterized membrane protein